MSRVNKPKNHVVDWLQSHEALWSGYPRVGMDDAIINALRADGIIHAKAKPDIVGLIAATRERRRRMVQRAAYTANHSLKGY